MRRLPKTLGAGWLVLICSASSTFAAALIDYTGTLGKLKIGLTITADNAAMGKPIPENGITGAHYYYASQLKDIELKLVGFSGRDVSFQESDASGKPVATFKLTFAKHDPQKHFTSKDDLWNEVLMGSWIPASGAAQDVYLYSTQTVSGDGKGGRCDLDGSAYAKLQDRAALFYKLAMKGDAKAVQQQFKVKLPQNASWRQELSQSPPHDLFCNAQGYMMGRGIVWFDPDGKVITINKF